MRISFATTQSARGSTMLGRVLPLAEALVARGHTVNVLGLAPEQALPTPIPFYVVGHEPFKRGTNGKIRYSGIRLVLTMSAAAVRTAVTLLYLNPDIVVIVKPLPQNTLGVWLYRMWRRRVKVVLDVDDFELTANVLDSFTQRAVLHACARLAVRTASQIVVATPFLSDHFKELAGGKKPVELLVTGYSLPHTLAAAQPTPVPTILYIGSVSISSGHRVDLLPQILKQVRGSIPNVQLIVAGDGDDTAQLKDAFMQQGLAAAVTWHGRFSSNQIPALVNQCQILIDPVDTSITQRAKSSSRVVLALAYAKPVITSNVGVRGMLLPKDWQQAWMVEPGNVDAYAVASIDALKNLLTHTQQEELHTQAAAYSWESLAADFEAVLKSL